MPSFSVKARYLYQLIGRTFTYDEIDTISANFGVELDDIVVEPDADGKINKDSLDAELKFDIGANRYDLLCAEGLARALRIYLGMETFPQHTIITPDEKDTITIIQDPSTLAIRPYVVGAVLRNVNFKRFDDIDGENPVVSSFMALQDKLHFNIGRQRQFVSIGTHDLDKIKGPITYTAKKASEISFVALNETVERNVQQLFKHYRSAASCHLKPYLDIAFAPQSDTLDALRAANTDETKVHGEDYDLLLPVIMDSTGTVLSLPPVINSEHSKITPDTKNVLIEITATDFTKANIVLNVVASLFSEHAVGDSQFSVEIVHISHPSGLTLPPGSETTIQRVGSYNPSVHNRFTLRYPNLTSRSTPVSVKDVNDYLGLKLTGPEIIELLKKMQLSSTGSTTDKDGNTMLDIAIPPTRSDVLHAVDIIEDVAISYGYNNIPLSLPTAMTIGGEQPLNALSNHLRYSLANCGYVEVITWALIQQEENFQKLRRAVTDSSVQLANSKTDFSACRTTLIPGLLKVVYANQSYGLPIQIFELGDVIIKSNTTAEGSVNVRHLGALFGGERSTFEEVHGVLTRVMGQLNVPFVSADQFVVDAKKPLTYTLRKSTTDDRTYLPTRCADIIISNGQTVGQIGTVNPEVLEEFDIGTFVPISIVEINIEPFL